MNTKDKQDFNKARNRIFKLMKDGKWHKSSKIKKVSRQEEGMRRMRELRKRSDVEAIEVVRISGKNREYRNRMILKP